MCVGVVPEWGVKLYMKYTTDIGYNLGYFESDGMAYSKDS
jgi:hypothetical protein